jgi:outer membrane biosynthesis protein TonB
MKCVPVVLGLLVLNVGSLFSFEGQKSRDSKEQRSVCWPGEREIKNPNPASRRPTRLPPELVDAKVQRSVVLLKACISESGDVPRVIVVQSSGNADVDGYYKAELSKWRFAPAERDKKKIRSVVDVAISLYIK